MSSSKPASEPPTSATGVAVPDEHNAAAAISARNVGKCYHIYEKPRDRLKQAVLGGFRTYYRPFWALHNVSFDVMPGEAVGILGRNGSGKSTLLQMIAGTLTPTEGDIHVRGRVAALLELGSGFNPEFTGRENVFLQGAILGIPRKEMERRFDAIVEFADIGGFIDQPVKHYSSGMYARLAFSVAVSVDPEVLIVDEILAVGDMGFQQKCAAKMRKLLDSGVTLLLVTHSPDTIKSLCQKGLFLIDGRPSFYGSSEEAVDRYHHYIREAVNEHAQRAIPAALAKPVAFGKDVKGQLRYGTGHAQIENVRILDAKGRPAEAFAFGDTVTVEIAARCMAPMTNLDVHFHVRDASGVDLFGTGTADEGVRFPELAESSVTTVRFRFQNNLRAGNYGVAVTLTKLPDTLEVGGVTLDHVSGVAAFASMANIHRPVTYKFHQPVTVDWTPAEPAAPRVQVAVPAGAAAPGV